jgi:hypothetical protein
MLENYPKFDAYLNRFSTQLKEMTVSHVKYIRKMGEWQGELRKSTTQLLKDIESEVQYQEGYNNNEAVQTLLTYGALTLQLEKASKTFHGIFQQHIDETNKIFGAFSGHWGSYIESVGVLYTLNYLRKEKGVHTSIQKFKRYFNKNRNVEIDLLAMSDTHCYIVEIKNQLKLEHFEQVNKNLFKLREGVPEYHHLMMQPILVCFHADPVMIEAIPTENDVWILQYHGFDKEKPTNTFEWIYQR